VLNRRTIIVFEKLERSFFRMPDSESTLACCETCGVEVCWLTPNQVVALTGMSLREVFRRIEAKEVHFAEMASGLLTVCPNSLKLDQL
jgi:hypothetical protein